MAVAVPWIASLAGIVFALHASPRVGAFVRVADLVGVPLLVFFWTHATVSRELRFGPVGDVAVVTPTGPFELSCFVPGRGGGLWLAVVKPRLLVRFRTVLLVSTRFGPRLLSRFVRRDGSEPEELVLERGAVLLAPSERTPA